MSTQKTGCLCVTKSVLTKAPLEKVWELYSNFHQIWIDGIAIEKIDEHTRVMATPDGGKVVERLTNCSSDQHTISYQMVEGALPVENYESTLQAKQEPNGTEVCVVWKATFDARGVDEKTAINAISQLYELGLNALKSKAEATN